VFVAVENTGDSMWHARSLLTVVTGQLAIQVSWGFD
jgi:hypothetical protein